MAEFRPIQVSANLLAGMQGAQQMQGARQANELRALQMQQAQGQMQRDEQFRNQLGTYLQGGTNALAQLYQTDPERAMQVQQFQGQQNQLARQRQVEEAKVAYAQAQGVINSAAPADYFRVLMPDQATAYAKQLGKGIDELTDDEATQIANQVATVAGSQAGLLPEYSAPTAGQQDGEDVFFQTDKMSGRTRVLPGISPKASTDAITERWRREVEAGYNGSLLDYQKELKAAGRPQVTVNSKQETEESKAVGRELGKQYAKIQEAGVSANAKVSRYERMSQLLDGVRTGKLTPKITEVAALADSLGIKLDPNIGEKQAVQALSNEVALQLRNPSGGAGMPGALSDKDREFLVSMTPGLANTPEGNKLIIQSAIKLAKRDQQIAKKARAYRAKNGTMEGFSEELAQWSADNPLFGGEAAIATAAQPSLTATGPNGEKIVLRNGRWVPADGN